MDQLMELEILITLFFQNLGTWLAPFFKIITFLGNEEFYLIVMPAIFWCVDATLGFRLAIMLVMTNSINGYFKVIFHSPRPYWVNSNVKAYIAETSFGLPSGHAQNAFGMWGILAATLKKTWVTIICVITIILIGLSRIYLGVHFSRDVISGWVLGGLLILLYLAIEKPIGRWIGKKSSWFKVLLTFLAAMGIVGLGLLFTFISHFKFQLPSTWISQAEASGNLTPDPFNIEGYFTIAGVWFGFISGYILTLAKKGKIIISGSIWKRIARYLVGILGLLALYLGLKLIFPDTYNWVGFLFRFIRYSLIGFWVSAAAPWLFEKLRLN